MSKKILVLSLVVLVIAPVLVFAGTRGCTSGMVTLGICRTTADVAYSLAIGTVDPDGAGPLQAPHLLLADAFASLYNWQSPAACTTEMVSAGICTVGQIGALVAITKAQFADLQVRAYVLSVLRRYRRQQQITAAESAADAEANPDLGQ
jgi:hypothetical protein